MDTMTTLKTPIISMQTAERRSKTMDNMNGEIVKHGPFTYEKSSVWMELIDYDGDDEVVIVPEEVDERIVCDL